MRLKTSKGKKVAYSLICAFVLLCLCLVVSLCFLCFLCFLVPLVRVKSFRKKNKEFKTALITSFTLLLVSLKYFNGFTVAVSSSLYFYSHKNCHILPGISGKVHITAKFQRIEFDKYATRDLHLYSRLYYIYLFNPLQPSVAFLYPLKTSENGFLMFSGAIEKQH